MPQRTCLLDQWKFCSIHGKLTAQCNCRGGFCSVFYAFMRLLYFLLSWFMDISSIPGLYLVSESLTRRGNSTSILWRDRIWGQCPKRAGSASQSWSASGRTPASTNQEHGETEGEGKWTKKSDCPNARLEKQQVLSGSPGKESSAGSCSAPCSWTWVSPLVPSALPPHLSSSLYLTDLTFTCGWGELMAPRSLDAFWAWNGAAKKALNSSFCLQSLSAFRLPLTSHSAHQLQLHIVHSGFLTNSG